MTTLELEMEVAELKTRLRRVERTLREEDESGPLLFPPQELPVNDEDLLDWLLDQGLTVAPTPDDKRLAAQWDRLPDDEKDAHVRLMHGLALVPALSEIIIENRR